MLLPLNVKILLGNLFLLSTTTIFRMTAHGFTAVSKSTFSRQHIYVSADLNSEPILSRRKNSPNRRIFRAMGTRRSTLSRLQAKQIDDKLQEDDESALSNAWLLTLIIPLLSAYISNQWSRSSIYYLVDFSADADPFRAFNVAIGMTEAQYGFLASVAFTTLFAVASLGAGLASDRYNRKTLTIVSCLGWSAATLGTALSHSYGEVVGWRIAMGLGG
jgi:hypothetical protein